MTDAKNISIFNFTSYKQIMDFYIRKSKNRGALSRAAEALNCQRSYLSRILNGDLHLTPDQSFLLAQFWKLTTLEQEYFQTLVEYERAASKSYRDFLKNKISELQKRNHSLTERMQRPQPQSINLQQANYFSSWQWAAIHFLTSIPEFQNITTLSEKLAINKEQLRVFLEKLKDAGLITNQGNRWIYSQGEFHIPKDSPFVIQHHLNWRHKAIIDAQMNTQESLHYTNVQTASRKDINKLKELLLSFITQSKELLDPSNPEEGVVVLCDIFNI